MSQYDDTPKRTTFEQQAEAEALFTSIGDGAISTDEFGRITRVNPVAQEIIGYTEAELLGQWFPKIITALTMDTKVVNLIDRPITKAFLTGKPIYEKMIYRRKSGESVPVSIVVSPILLDGKPLGAVEVFRDITLEEEIDRMKSEFISLASHQLRTPLSAIKTYSHMLIDGYMGDITPAQKKSLRTIISGANRMNELISTLLNITRIESGTIAVTPKVIDVDSVIDEIVKEVSMMAADKAVEVVAKESPKPVTIRTDLLIFKEIVTNLVTNGVKYTPEGGSVIVQAKKRSADLLVTVSDTGWGIPKQSQDQIFSKFFRAPNIVRRETTGTGLGLYLVKGLVETLGGKIWFKSEEGKGTKFYLSIKPLKKQPAAKPKGEVPQP
ncbi:MAG: PAS domain-containing sensor histidine kinase [Patescibacteria group bacterium]|nr:PAS domain-containing sensor histidine kinase [Patescibacteria group bacterium]